jgi:hypothetical protein
MAWIVTPTHPREYNVDMGQSVSPRHPLSTIRRHAMRVAAFASMMAMFGDLLTAVPLFTPSSTAQHSRNNGEEEPRGEEISSVLLNRSSARAPTASADILSSSQRVRSHRQALASPSQASRQATSAKGPHGPHLRC